MIEQQMFEFEIVFSSGSNLAGLCRPLSLSTVFGVWRYFLGVSCREALKNPVQDVYSIPRKRPEDGFRIFEGSDCWFQVVHSSNHISFVLGYIARYKKAKAKVSEQIGPSSLHSLQNVVAVALSKRATSITRIVEETKHTYKATKKANEQANKPTNSNTNSPLYSAAKKIYDCHNKI